MSDHAWERLRPIVNMLTEAIEPEHLDYEQLAAAADGTADPIDREIVESHAALCGACARELRDLRAFRDSLVRPRRPAWLAAAASLLIAILAGAYFVERQPVARVHDAGRDIAVLRSGGVSGIAVGDEERRDVARALTRGELPLAPTDLAAGRQQLLGAEVTTPLALVAPLRSVVANDRPTFVWTAVAGARYRVEVFDAHYRPVAASPFLDTTRWTTTRALPRGTTYSWQVTARIGGETVSVPAPPEPEARFRVMDTAHFDEVRRLAAQQPPSHLALALAYARGGDAGDAQREIETLAAANRDSVAAQRLLRTVRSWSR